MPAPDGLAHGVAAGWLSGWGRSVFRWMRSRWSRRAATSGGVFAARLGFDDGELTFLESDLAPPGGPYDVALAPSDGLRRLDLGSLLVPLLDGIEYQLRLDGGRVRAVVALAGRSTMELTVSAAPRSRGIWDEIRAEVCLAAALPGPGHPPPPTATDRRDEPGRASSSARQTMLNVPAWTGGPVEVTAIHGRFGPELRLVALAPPQPPDAPAPPAARGSTTPQPAAPDAVDALRVADGPPVLSGLTGPVRLVGIDGPRWFLQAALAGPAADRRDESLMDDVLRGTIVIRGGHAMPVRAPLPLRLPTETENPVGPDDLIDPVAAAADPDGPPPTGTSARQLAPRRLGAPGPAMPTDLESLRARPTGASSADPRRVSYEVISRPGGLGRNLMTWG